MPLTHLQATICLRSFLSSALPSDHCRTWASRATYPTGLPLYSERWLYSSMTRIQPFPTASCQRRTPSSVQQPKAEAAETVKGEESAGEEAQAGAARRGPKGWAGEMPRARVSRSASEDHRELRGEVKREPEESSSGAPMEVEAAGLDVAEVRPVPPRVMTPAPAHPLLQLDGGDEAVDLETTLDRLSSATNVRVDDVGFALSELGLLKLASKAGGEGPVIVITRDMVRQAIKRNRVKRPVLDVMYVLAV